MPKDAKQTEQLADSPKNKFELSNMQKEYLQLLLPKFMGLTSTEHNDEKKSRNSKNTEQLYQPDSCKHTGVSGHFSGGSKKTSWKEEGKYRGKEDCEGGRQTKKPKGKTLKPKEQTKHVSNPPQNDQQKQTIRRNSNLSQNIPNHEPQKNADEVKVEETEFGAKALIHKKNKKMENQDLRKTKSKKKTSVKQTLSDDPNEFPESHSLAPPQSSQTAENKGIRGRLTKQLSINQENSRRSLNFNHQSSQNMYQEGENSLNENKRLQTEQKKICSKILNKLKSHKSSWPFRLPVDPVAQGVPNYLQIVHQAMDLKTIQKRLHGNKYEHPSQFHWDLSKIFLNSYKFNSRQTNYYKLTIQLQAEYHSLMYLSKVDPNFLNNDESRIRDNAEQDFIEEFPMRRRKSALVPKKARDRVKRKKSLKEEREQYEQRVSQLFGEDIFDEEGFTPVKFQVKQEQLYSDNWPQKIIEEPKRSKTHFTPPKQPSKKMNRSGKKAAPKKTYSIAEKKDLTERIRRLSTDALQQILMMLYGEEEATSIFFKEEIEIDLRQIPDETIAILQNLVKEKEAGKGEQITRLDKYFTEEKLDLL